MPGESRRGDPYAALRTADVKVDSTYVIAREDHNPIEPHATTAVWNAGTLTLWTKTQWVSNTGAEIAATFGIPPEHVEVVSRHVGGAFVAIRHEGTAATSRYEQYAENLLGPTRFLYRCPNVATRHRLAEMNVNTPCSMRAPGEISGIFALESAIDELAEALDIDPVELCLRNDTDHDQGRNLPFSSRGLRDCLVAAGQCFGWDRRDPRHRIDARRAGTTDRLRMFRRWDCPSRRCARRVRRGEAPSPRTGGGDQQRRRTRRCHGGG
ncbi:xanthine dehydrogenase family protein molybdopterin-binding subunit [Streptomyces sp. NPDC004561]